MTPDELSAQEEKADRFLRRGELLQALALYRQIVAASPERQDLVIRMRQLAESMDPAELRAASTAPADELTKTAPTTPEEEGERLFQKGDYAGAAAAYRKALELKPSSDLVRERLVELFQLAQAQNGRPQTARGMLATASAQAAASGAREAFFRELLERVSERRRR